MYEVLEKINPGDEREISEEEWNAIADLLKALDLDNDIEIGLHHGKKRFRDKEEDRPLAQEPTLKLISEKYIKRSFGEYGLDSGKCGLLENLFRDYGYPAF